MQHLKPFVYKSTYYDCFTLLLFKKTNGGRFLLNYFFFILQYNLHEWRLLPFLWAVNSNFQQYNKYRSIIPFKTNTKVCINLTGNAKRSLLGSFVVLFLLRRHLWVKLARRLDRPGFNTETSICKPPVEKVLSLGIVLNSITNRLPFTFDGISNQLLQAASLVAAKEIHLVHAVAAEG